MSGTDAAVDGPPKATLEESMKFYNEITRPRRVVKFGTDDDYRKLEPGEFEEGSANYSTWETKVDELADFGLGIVLYFKMLIYLFAVCIVCGCIQLVNVGYFTGDGTLDPSTAQVGSYSNGQVRELKEIINNHIFLVVVLLLLSPSFFSLFSFFFFLSSPLLIIII
jgi:hypothetical protein